MPSTLNRKTLAGTSLNKIFLERDNSLLKLFFQFFIAFLLFIVLPSCSTKSYFTKEIRDIVEANNNSLTKLQFYIDRDVELRRELSSGDIKVSSGKVKFENGKYIHIIFLKKYTPGICTKVSKNSIDVSFEAGEGKNLSFETISEFDTQSDETYKIVPDEPLNNRTSFAYFKIKYDGYIYMMKAGDTGDALPKLMINKSVIGNLKVERTRMKGQKIK